jgi:hypothetical protein
VPAPVLGMNSPQPSTTWPPSAVALLHLASRRGQRAADWSGGRAARDGGGGGAELDGAAARWSSRGRRPPAGAAAGRAAGRSTCVQGGGRRHREDDMWGPPSTIYIEWSDLVSLLELTII